MIHHIPSLFVARAGKKGRGIYTTEDIAKDTLIEVCPIILLPEKDYKKIHTSALHDYYFVWGDNEKVLAIALGYGSIYNHAIKPNADFIFDMTNETIDIVCIKNIKAGDEITINYHGEPGNEDDLWFKVKK